MAGRSGPRTLHAGPGPRLHNYTESVDRLERVCPGMPHGCTEATTLKLLGQECPTDHQTDLPGRDHRPSTSARPTARPLCSRAFLRVSATSPPQAAQPENPEQSLCLWLRSCDFRSGRTANPPLEGLSRPEIGFVRALSGCCPSVGLLLADRDHEILNTARPATVDRQSSIGSPRRQPQAGRTTVRGHSVLLRREPTACMIGRRGGGQEARGSPGLAGELPAGPGDSDNRIAKERAHPV